MEDLMPISLRLPTEIEDQIAGFSERQGMTKSAVIVRSIREFLDRNAQPSSLQIYEEVMKSGADDSGDAQKDAKRQAAEQRPHKLLVRDAIRKKHAARSVSALKSGKAQ
jgi:predicted DNA-binding protein